MVGFVLVLLLVVGEEITVRVQMFHLEIKYIKLESSKRDGVPGICRAQNKIPSRQQRLFLFFCSSYTVSDPDQEAWKCYKTWIPDCQFDT